MDKIVYSPDGKTLACIQGESVTDTAIELRDSRSGSVLKTIPMPERTLLWLAYLPDGQLLAAGGVANSGLWRIQNNSAQQVELPGKNDYPGGMAISADGRLLATTFFKGVMIVDLATGQLRQTLLATDAPILAADKFAFSPDGRILAAAQTGTIALMDLATGKPYYVIRNLPQNVGSMTFSPDNKTLTYSLSNGVNGIFRVNVATGYQLPAFQGVPGETPDLLYTPDSTRLLSSSWEEGSAFAWDARLGRIQHVLPAMPPHTEWQRDPNTGRIIGKTTSPGRPVTGLALSLDGLTLAGTDGRDVLLWDMATSRLRNAAVPPPENIWNAAFTDKGRSIISSHTNGVLARWDIKTGKLLGTVWTGAYSVEAVTASPDGRSVAAVAGREVILWDSALSKELGTLPIGISDAPTIPFSPDGRTLAVAAENSVLLWDTQSFAVLQTLPSQGVVEDVAYLPSGNALVTADNMLRLWNTHTGHMLWQVQAHEHGVSTVAVSPDGGLIASGGSDGTVKIWNAADGSAGGPSFSFGTLRDGRSGGIRPREVSSVAFSPDGTELAAGGEFGYLVLWDTKSWLEIKRIPWKGGGRQKLCFSPDGRMLIQVDFKSLSLYNLQIGKTQLIFQGPGM